MRVLWAILDALFSDLAIYREWRGGKWIKETFYEPPATAWDQGYYERWKRT